MLNESNTTVSDSKSFKNRVAKKVLRVARKAGFFRAYSTIRSRMVRRKVAILAYHRIDWDVNYPWSITPVTPENFDLEMRYLHQRYRVISLEELSAALQNFEDLSPNIAVVTIDDGYRDMYINAYPILKKYNIPATVFLATDHIGTGKLLWTHKVRYMIWKTKLDTLELGELGIYHLNSAETRQSIGNTVVTRLKQLPVDNRDELIERLVRLCGVDIPPNIGKEFFLSWDEIREMSQNGISFGAHTVSHPILTRVPLEVAKKEILDSKQHIETELDQEVTTFCYPNGEPGDFNNDIEEILKNNGFRCAVTLVPVAFVSPATQPYRLPRITGASSLDTFELLMSGLYIDLVAKRGNHRENKI